MGFFEMEFRNAFSVDGFLYNPHCAYINAFYGIARADGVNEPREYILFGDSSVGIRSFCLRPLVVQSEHQVQKSCMRAG